MILLRREVSEVNQTPANRSLMPQRQREAVREGGRPRLTGAKLRVRLVCGPAVGGAVAFPSCDLPLLRHVLPHAAPCHRTLLLASREPLWQGTGSAEPDIWGSGCW